MHENETPRDAARPMDQDEKRSVEITSAPATGLAGAAAGAATGLATLTLGPIGAGIGAVVGAVAGSLGGWFAGQAVTQVPYDEHVDAHYRALYDGSSTRLADRSFEHVRPAYQYGHVAAHNPEWSGRDFDALDADLRRGWDGGLHTQHGQWEQVRPYARDAFGHARSEGAGARRDEAVIGSAGSAVDPVELDRARRGEFSTDYTPPIGTSESHDRTSANDPLPPADRATTGSPPGWMERPVDQGGGGARLDERAERDSRRPGDPAPRTDSEFM